LNARSCNEKRDLHVCGLNDCHRREKSHYGVVEREQKVIMKVDYDTTFSCSCCKVDEGGFD